MVEIKSREEANKYYKIVNEIIDNFIDNTNARPVEVYSYIKKNLSKFISDNKLADVVGIKRIVNDIIEHRKYMQDDKIVTFENFNRIYEDISDLKSNDTRKIKILSDFFHTSSGHIEVVNQDLNIYTIKDYDQTLECVILSQSDFSQIKSKLKKDLLNRISSKKLDLLPILSPYLTKPESITLKNFIDFEKISNYLDNYIQEDSCLKYLEIYLKGLQNSKYFEINLVPLGITHQYKIFNIIYK